jgi:phage tail sheath protein FI
LIATEHDTNSQIEKEHDMPSYLSPGVYVEEVPSAVKPIAGVSTSTAAFIGIVPDSIQIPEENPDYDPTGRDTSDEAKLPYRTWSFPFPTDRPTDAGAATAFDGSDAGKMFKLLTDAQSSLKDLAADPNNPNRPSKATSVDTTKLQKFRDSQRTVARYASYQAAGTMATEGVPVLCTTFTDFKRSFGDFSMDGVDFKSGSDLSTIPAGTGLQSHLAHAVFGFFNNGGTRCWVMRYKDIGELRNPENLAPLEAIDEISLVAAPGIVDTGVQLNLVDHCTNMADRFAILDAPVLPVSDMFANDIMADTRATDYGALYFPWITVFDPTTQYLHPEGDGEWLCPPSGHIAGIYARVDQQRGVFKAPANEVVRGAIDLEMKVSRAQQDGLNPVGINVIRFINDNVTVWGARTIGGDANTDLKYINVRRTLIFLRKSIDRGTQWMVFEPNDPGLWGKAKLNVTAFLTTVWRDGALFGSTPDEAFYVKCDAETNPPEDRDLGRVTIEIGVSIVRPAEFVIFRISQWEGPTAQ